MSSVAIDSVSCVVQNLIEQTYATLIEVEAAAGDRGEPPSLRSSFDEPRDGAQAVQRGDWRAVDIANLFRPSICDSLNYHLAQAQDERVCVVKLIQKSLPSNSDATRPRWTRCRPTPASSLPSSTVVCLRGSAAPKLENVRNRADHRRSGSASAMSSSPRNDYVVAMSTSPSLSCRRR